MGLGLGDIFGGLAGALTGCSSSPIVQAGLPIAGMAIGGAPGAMIGGQLAGYMSQQATNQQMQQFSLDMWNRNNAYNTPAMQRKRLEEAGYNPNLMYGQGTVGNSSSPATSPNLKAPQMEVNPILMAQTELLKAQIANVNADTKNKISSNPYINANAGVKELEQGRRLATYNDDIAKSWEEAKQVKLVNDIKTIEKAFIAQGKQSAINEINARIDNLKKAGGLLDQEKEIKNFEIILNKYGVSKGDELYQRMLALLANKILPQLQNQ